jgi:glycerol-3-phosphate acyltransferase PlsY
MALTVSIVLKLVAAYLLGSLNGSLVLGRFRHIDIRQEGSGNAGGTNALRTHGKLFALGVMIIDVMKAVVAVIVLPGLGGAPAGLLPWLEVGTGAAAVLGHCYPIFFGFRGGKGMATLLGVYAVLAPKVLLIVLVTWLIVMSLTGYVGLATMIAAASAPAWLIVTGDVPAGHLILFSIIMAGFIVFTHRGNIERLLGGAEHRIFRGLLGRRS